MLENWLNFSRLPPEYIFFIARGIIIGEKIDLPEKIDYSIEELQIIFSCQSIQELTEKISEIEKATIIALSLPKKDFYTIEDFADQIYL